MATVVPGPAFTSGALASLGICPQHGELATGTRRRTFCSKTPAWIYAIAIPSLLIAAIVQLATRKTLKGPLPECASCRQAVVRYRLWLVAIVVAGVLFVAVAAQGSLDALGALGVVMVIGGSLAFATVDTVRTKAWVSRDGAWLEVRKPAPAFAAAVQARMAAAQITPPGPPPASQR